MIERQTDRPPTLEERREKPPVTLTKLVLTNLVEWQTLHGAHHSKNSSLW